MGGLSARLADWLLTCACLVEGQDFCEFTSPAQPPVSRAQPHPASVCVPSTTASPLSASAAACSSAPETHHRRCSTVGIILICVHQRHILYRQAHKELRYQVSRCCRNYIYIVVYPPLCLLRCTMPPCRVFILSIHDCHSSTNAPPGQILPLHIGQNGYVHCI